MGLSYSSLVNEKWKLSLPKKKKNIFKFYIKLIDNYALALPFVKSIFPSCQICLAMECIHLPHFFHNKCFHRVSAIDEYQFHLDHPIQTKGKSLLNEVDLLYSQNLTYI